MTRARGFAAWSPEKRAAAAAKGGRASHAMGTGHEWTKEAAAAAGRLGGLRTAEKKREREEEERAARDAQAASDKDARDEKLSRFYGLGVNDDGE